MGESELVDALLSESFVLCDVVLEILNEIDALGVDKQISSSPMYFGPGFDDSCLGGTGEGENNLNV